MHNIAFFAAASRGSSIWTVAFLFGAPLLIILCCDLYKKGKSAGHREADDALKRGQDKREQALDQREDYLKEKFAEVDSERAKIREEFAIVAQKMSEAQKKFDDAYQNGIKKKEEELRQIVHEAIASHPDNKHVSRLLDDAETLLVEKNIDYMGWSASSTADRMRKRFNEAYRRTKLEARFYKYQAALYEFLVPKLSEYSAAITEIESDAVKTDESDWLSEDEYQRLGDVERSQLALDRYIGSRKKSRWQVGRDYELYIGYLYRKGGWSVVQTGIRDGLEDLGRDLICRKKNEVHVVQCKYWAKDKLIREKYIAQLYGTTVAYEIGAKRRRNRSQMLLFDDGGEDVVNAVFVTSTDLSDEAKDFAEKLGVILRLNENIGEFPRIKCNVGKNGEKIFHLPFDQQYDNTVVTEEKGDCYATTVQEAVDKGFRRAKRHVIES